MIKSNLFHQLLEIYGINSINFQTYYDEIKLEIKQDEENTNKEESNKLKEVQRLSVDKIEKSYNIFNVLKGNNIPNIKLKLKDNSNEHKTAESRNQRNSHLYIDCTFNALNSVDTLPPINLKTQKNVNKPIIKLTKELDTRVRESKFLTSKKLNIIHIEELTSDKKKEINDSNQFRRHHRMKTDKFIDIKHTLPKRNLFVNFN